MILAQDLPPSKNAYDYPIHVAGEELTDQQKEQASLSQIASIIAGVAAGKKAITDAVTMQVVALLRSTDLGSEVALRAFAKQAAIIVNMGIKQARLLTWAGVSSRSKIMGIDFPVVMPDIQSFPKELRGSRKSSLENAYYRLGKEYKKYRELPQSHPNVKELVKQMEAQALTPIPRPDNISSDAIEREVSDNVEWQKAFREAEEESRKETGRKFAWEKSREKAHKKAEGRGSPTATPGEDKPGGDQRSATEILSSGRTSKPSVDDAEQPKGKSKSTEAFVADGEPEARINLNTAEIDRVIEQYAQQKVEERAERMVSQDIQGASRNTYAVAQSKLPKTVTGYRRVIHPELSKSGQSCGLCIVASTNIYSRGDLLPIHSGCNCEVSEIYSTKEGVFDPGHQINLADLEVFYIEAEGSTNGWDLKKSRYKVVDHPEYGKTLVNAKSKPGEEEFISFDDHDH